MAENNEWDGESEARVLGVDDLWPGSLDSYSTESLQRMDEMEFRILQQRVARRALVRSGSHKHANELVRRLKRRRNPHRVELPKHLLARRFKESVILGGLFPTRARDWLPVHRRRHISEISVVNFSFLDEPVHTMRLLSSMARAECTDLSASVHFDDEMMLDIGPFLVWGLMRQDMLPYMRGGRIANQTKSVIEAVELQRFMGIGLRSIERSQEVSPFALRRRRGTGTSTGDNLALSVTTKEKVADDFADTVDLWLEKMSPPEELTEEARSWLLGILTEVLDNAERHSHHAGDGDWAIAGFMVRRNVTNVTDSSTRPFFVCHLAIVSVGVSIAESILATDVDELRQDIDAYCRKHSGAGQTSEALATVYALQDGISRFSQGDDRAKGGVGMMDMVEFVCSLGQFGARELPTQIAIISGSTCVLFRSPYNDFGRDVADHRKRLQWFNSSNSIDMPPDRTHVIGLTQRFPGTVISLRVSLPAEEVGDPAVETHGYD